MSFPALKTLPRKVGVVVATHNRAHYLPIALQSILNQTHKPERILVVDDGSTDGTRDIVRKFPGVEYHYVNLGKGEHPCYAKRYGFDILADADLPYVCCVDSDDWIDANYLAALLDTMESDCRVGVAYPLLEQFGERTGTFDHPYGDGRILARTNIAPSTSLMRSDALIQIGGWPLVGKTEHDDWSAWRRMRAHGWLLKQCRETRYHWRRHADSQTFRFRGRGADHVLQWCHTVDKEDLITIAIPFCGRHRTLDAQLAWLGTQTYPHGLTRLLFFDNSCDSTFARRLRAWLSNCDYASYTYFPCHIRATDGQSNCQTADSDRKQHSTSVNHRCAGNWNRIAQLVQTDLVLCLEDDIIPPLDVIERLLRGMGPDVAAVSAVYPGRGCRWVVKDFASLDPLRPVEKHVFSGIQPCGAPGMGCVLVRREALQSTPMRSRGVDAGHDWFDWNLWADVHRQPELGRVLIDGDLVCDHLME